MTTMKPTEPIGGVLPASSDELLSAQRTVVAAQLRVVLIRLTRAQGADLETLKLEQLRLESELLALDRKLDFAKKHD